jgi:Patatin-like phospholipase
MSNTVTQRLRNYRSVREEHIECTIWQAARATSAAPTFFDAITFPNGLTFSDGGLRDNNPIFELIDEVVREFPGRDIATVLSLGTGVSTSISLGNGGLISVAKACSQIATDTEGIARRFTETHCRPGGRFRNNYFRFNVAQGLQNVSLEEWEKVDEMQASTQNYLQQEDEMLLSCVRSLKLVVEE